MDFIKAFKQEEPLQNQEDLKKYIDACYYTILKQNNIPDKAKLVYDELSNTTYATTKHFEDDNITITFNSSYIKDANPKSIFFTVAHELYHVKQFILNGEYTPNFIDKTQTELKNTYYENLILLLRLKKRLSLEHTWEDDIETQFSPTEQKSKDREFKKKQRIISKFEKICTIGFTYANNEMWLADPEELKANLFARKQLIKCMKENNVALRKLSEISFEKLQIADQYKSILFRPSIMLRGRNLIKTISKAKRAAIKAFFFDDISPQNITIHKTNAPDLSNDSDYNGISK